jgi:glycosyltransferase involved in cell wall biosynthesis
VFRQYDAFAVPNNRSGDYARTEAGNSKPILPLANTVDEEFYTPPEDLDRDSLRDGLGVAHGSRVIVSVAQLNDRKGVLELARGYGLLPAELRQNSTLVILGEGERRRELEGIVESIDPGEVRLVGHVPAEAVRRWLWVADIFCLATRMDPNPLSPIEASFARLPLLLSSKAGNFDELVREGETGWRIDSIQDGVIRDRLALALSTDDARIRQMGFAASKNANDSFRRSSVAQRFVTALLEAFPF